MDRFDERLLQPVKAYNNAYKGEFRKNAENLFDSLVKRSGMDLEENRATVKKLKSLRANIASLNSTMSKKKGLRGFLIFLSIVLMAVAVFLVVGYAQDSYFDSMPIGAAVACFALGLVILIVFCRKLKTAIASLSSQIEKLQKEAAQTEELAWKQMEALNALFDSHMTQDLMEKTVPLLDFDYLFSIERYQHLHDRYGFRQNESDDLSTIGILSGEINGNPFVIDRNLVRSDGVETYTGSIVIHWTTISRDSKGNTHTVHHTQTLTASVQKFKPVYGERTCLIYGNDGAPDLTFKRTPNHVEKLDDKSFKRFVAKKVRKMERKQDKAVGSAGSFTSMNNSDFDACFGALDRDNEVQFRVMYTPLAQNNTMELLRDKDNYGDDFVFHKKGPINIICSEHAQKRDMDTDNTRFRSYDADECRKEFLAFNCEYFRSVFFDFAPLLCVPVYQQVKPHGYIYSGHKERNYTDYEAEYLANKLGEDAFSPSDAATRCILKTNLVETNGSSDRLEVVAHAYRTEERVDLVTKLGGDGRLHEIPVHWLEYIPVTKSTGICIKDMKYSDNRFAQVLSNPAFRAIVNGFTDRYTYSHGMLCMLADGDCTDFDIKTTEYLNTNRNSNLNNNINIANEEV